MGHVYHRHCSERSHGKEDVYTRHTFSVVPANAGTHNHKKEFGEA
ncbi:hypothetical protein [Bradyrhizobium sp. 2]|nr:hypothetical protein [Bradyrhizobium sp. 2]